MSSKSFWKCKRVIVLLIKARCALKSSLTISFAPTFLTFCLALEKNFELISSSQIRELGEPNDWSLYHYTNLCRKKKKKTQAYNNIVTFSALPPPLLQPLANLIAINSHLLNGMNKRLIILLFKSKDTSNLGGDQCQSIALLVTMGMCNFIFFLKLLFKGLKLEGIDPWFLFPFLL